MKKSLPLKIGIVAGEASGDLLGAKLIDALRQRCPSLEVRGLGGSAMREAGCKSLYEMSRLSMMGFFEPLLHLPDLIQLRRDLYRHFSEQKPDVFIGIDAPDFNLGLELKLKQVGIPIVHYVSPSVWAWRQRRIFKIAQAVDLMLTLFPFEKEIYEKHHIPVCYVGHPLADKIPLAIDRNAACNALNLDEKVTYIALLPGSRKQELRYMAEPLLLAAKRCWQERPQLRFITAHVNERRKQEFYKLYQQYAPDLPLEFFTQRSADVMAAADVIVVGSGTATLEAMLYKKPMIIVYRMSPVTYQLARHLVKVPYIGLPNLLAQESLVPELIQKAAKPEKIAQHIFDYLDHPAKVDALRQSFTRLHKELSVNSADRAADAIVDFVGKK